MNQQQDTIDEAGKASAEALPTTGSNREQRQRLGEFIRLHRARITPEIAGLADTSRRRTPGLRREELAALCRVSLTWVTWLEQGRDVAASAAVLARLSEALHLSPAERAYLFELSGRRDPASPSLADEAPSPPVLGSVHAMNCPAYVLDKRWDVVAANDRARELFLNWGEDADHGGQEGVEPPNLLRFLFLRPESRKLIHDWETRSWRLVAEFRADCGRLADTPAIKELIDGLRAISPDFERCWLTQDVLEREGGERSFNHPTLGELRYEQLTLHPAIRSDLKLVMLLA